MNVSLTNGLTKLENDMTSDQIERNNEMAQIALDGEMRFEQAKQMIKSGNISLALTHIRQAHQVAERLECELKFKIG
jgi:hypothetical protein